MKNLFRTTTALLLTLGLSFTLPRIMNSETIDTPMSQNNIPVELKVDSSMTLEQSKTSTEISELKKNEFQIKNQEILDINKKNEGNFPIKTDNLQLAVKVEPKVESNNQNDSKNNGSSIATNPSKVDNISQIDEKPQDVQSEITEPTLNTPDTAPKTTVTVINASYDRYAKSTLNIRKGPSTSHQRISTLKAGQKVLVTKILSSGWSFIESNGVKGYVSSSYLLKTAPVVSVPTKPATVPQAPTSAPVAPAPTTSPAAQKTTVTVVNASYERYAKSTLNIRKGPSTSHQKISTLKAGQKVLVTKILSSGWSFIESNGVKGYVSSSYLLKTAPVVSVPAKPATVPQAPTTTPVTPTPTTSPTAPKPVPTSPTYSAYRMIVGGKTLPYKNGGISKGQSIIDANTGSLSTWGGAETYSGTDGKNTHFIGHNPGAFDVLLRVSNGATIIVTDGNGNPTSYTVTKIFKVDDNAYNKSDGTNYYNYMVSTRGGEVITLQTCLSSDENLIIRAEKK